jgi:hypothetical protein
MALVESAKMRTGESLTNKSRGRFVVRLAASEIDGAKCS